jgi:hypothetical protein
MKATAFILAMLPLVGQTPPAAESQKPAAGAPKPAADSPAPAAESPKPAPDSTVSTRELTTGATIRIQHSTYVF